MKKLTAFLLGLLMSSVFYYGFYLCKRSRTQNASNDSVIHTIVNDTIYYRMPVVYDSVVIRYINKPITISKQIKKDSVVEFHEDTITVSIPISQKEYRDSNYVAWVSGYNPCLDSINIFQKTNVTTIYQPIPAPSKSKRWGIGIQTGIGITPTKIEPYIGIGVSYNLFQW